MRKPEAHEAAAAVAPDAAAAGADAAGAGDAAAADAAAGAGGGKDTPKRKRKSGGGSCHKCGGVHNPAQLRECPDCQMRYHAYDCGKRYAKKQPAFERFDAVTQDGITDSCPNVRRLCCSWCRSWCRSG